MGEKNDRYGLVRLVEAIQEFGDTPASRPARGSEEPRTARVKTYTTWSILETMEANRRKNARLRHQLPVHYSENLTTGELEEIPMEKGLELLEWIRKTVRERDGGRRSFSDLRLIIHLQAIRGQLVYFVAFAGEGDPEVAAQRPRDMDISSSGLRFPTERCHRRGERLFLLLFLPTSPPSFLRLKASVVRTSRKASGGGYQTPVAFIQQSEEDTEQILQFISSWQTQRLLTKVYRLDPGR